MIATQIRSATNNAEYHCIHIADTAEADEDDKAGRTGTNHTRVPHVGHKHENGHNNIADADTCPKQGGVKLQCLKKKRTTMRN